MYGGVNNYSNTQANYPNFSRQRNYSYGILVRKYKTLKGGFSLYLQGNLGGNTNKYETNYFTTSPFTDTQKGQGISLSVNPGISYQVSAKIQVEAGFQSLVSFAYTNTNFTSNNPQYTGAQNQKTFAFNSSINNFMSQVYLGFRFLLQKK